METLQKTADIVNPYLVECNASDFLLWERHLLAAAAFSEGWLPRNRGWKPPTKSISISSAPHLEKGG
jgi:hypothetical protein